MGAINGGVCYPDSSETIPVVDGRPVLHAYADNAAALAGGLAVGDNYFDTTTGTLEVVHAAGSQGGY